MPTALNSDFRDAPTVSATSLTKSAIPALAGRILIASIFLLSGVSKVTAPAMMIGYIQSVGLPAPMLALGVAIAVELLGGIALVLGWAIVRAGHCLTCLALLKTSSIMPSRPRPARAGRPCASRGPS